MDATGTSRRRRAPRRYLPPRPRGGRVADRHGVSRLIVTARVLKTSKPFRARHASDHLKPKTPSPSLSLQSSSRVETQIKATARPPPRSMHHKRAAHKLGATGSRALSFPSSNIPHTQIVR
ncbi:hypothetical protein MAPG_03497 [Magnaporthiopsis poae ATCC 64411]|uniref:Uncharacterized protein n=1 Tax=Magnaporthiopsis poae (strain ATCC 64411 / 73-15) TaxID=644358 RepID=A0A0C4DU62_MAGP6|nr:hypothetical protein MAPG_03497 [Magnaporthiopsis poae ATCC 64411]